jgi:hypothetical protein
LGPASPQLQDPYHHSLRPEQGNSKAQTKSFLPQHNLKRGKKKTETKEQEGRTLGNKKSRAKERKTKAEESHRDQNHCRYCLRQGRNEGVASRGPGPCKIFFFYLVIKCEKL